ncbi:MAG: DUF4382 domain-containing protein [Nitrospirae bacterium]|nr:DUF4382 domain-containing protein [Nitrospirota bacterium]
MKLKSGLIAIAGIIFFTGIVGCGSTGSTGGEQSSGANAGKVGILIKDDLLSRPSDRANDIPELSQLWVTIKKVSIMKGSIENDNDCGSMDEDKWLTVFEGTARYDLLTLQGNNASLMSLVPVPADMAGYYEKARIELDETTGKNCFYALPDGVADDPLNPCTDNDAYLLNVPSGKIDIKFKNDIYLGPDTTEYIVFDLLPADSIKIANPAGLDEYQLRPVILAYTMPSLIDDKGWDDMKVEEVKGLITEIIGCDNPDLPDTLILSSENDGVNVSIDITEAVISLDDSAEFVTCGFLLPGQKVELHVSLSSDGTMTADKIEME